VEGRDPNSLQDPSTFGKDVTGTVLENVTLSHSRLGAYIRGDGLVIRNSLITDTITEGLYISASSDVLLERNIIRRNNITLLTGMFPAGVKIFNQTRRVVCRDNLVTDQPYSNGIWYDVGNRDGVFINNYIQDAQAGLFFEISRGITVAGNVFVRCQMGIRILNSADARVYNNTFVNTPATFSRNTRSAVGDTFGWHPSTGPDVDQREGHVFVNNLLVSDTYRGPLLRVEQAAALCGKLTRTPMKALAGNVFARPSVPGDAATALISWSPSEGEGCTSNPVSMVDFRKSAPAFETAGQQADATPRSVFKGADLGNYELLKTVAQPAAETLPEDIRKLLGWTEAQARTHGAYPSR
jgi:parallel beta-helix repeat protein